VSFFPQEFPYFLKRGLLVFVMCRLAAGQLRSTNVAVTADSSGVSWSPSTGSLSFFSAYRQETSTLNPFDGGSDRKEYKCKVTGISAKDKKKSNSLGILEQKKSKPAVVALSGCEDKEVQKCEVVTGELLKSLKSSEVSDLHFVLV